MSPEAVRARSVTYGSPGAGWLIDLSPIRISPETELRSSHAANWSATPMVNEPDADRRSTEPVVEGTEISPDPELACRFARCNDRRAISPDPDLALTEQWASVI